MILPPINNSNLEKKLFQPISLTALASKNVAQQLKSLTTLNPVTITSIEVLENGLSNKTKSLLLQQLRPRAFQICQMAKGKTEEFSPHGNCWLILHQKEGIRVYNKEKSSFWLENSKECQEAHWSSTGKYIHARQLFATQPIETVSGKELFEKCHIQVWDATNGKAIYTTDDKNYDKYDHIYWTHDDKYLLIHQSSNSPIHMIDIAKTYDTVYRHPYIDPAFFSRYQDPQSRFIILERRSIAHFSTAASGGLSFAMPLPRKNTYDKGSWQFSDDGTRLYSVCHKENLETGRCNSYFIQCQPRNDRLYHRINLGSYYSHIYLNKEKNRILASNGHVSTSKICDANSGECLYEQRQFDGKDRLHYFEDLSHGIIFKNYNEQDSSREIALKDLKGNILREWKLAGRFERVYQAHDTNYILLTNFPLHHIGIGVGAILHQDSDEPILQFEGFFDKSDLDLPFGQAHPHFSAANLYSIRTYGGFQIWQLPRVGFNEKTTLKEMAAFYVLKNNREKMHEPCNQAKDVLLASSNNSLKKYAEK